MSGDRFAGGSGDRFAGGNRGPQQAVVLTPVYRKDFCWDELSKVLLPGWVIHRGKLVAKEQAPKSSPATLQDYWRDQEHALVAELGSDGEAARHWTRFHLPWTWPDGSPTEKTHWSEDEWKALDQVLIGKLFSASETKASSYNSSLEFDGRAQLQGGVLRALPIQITGALHVNAEKLQILKKANFSKCLFGSEASFKGAEFYQDADFSESTFQGHANFKDCRFSGSCDFSAASFALRVEFDRSEFAYCNFSRAQFRNNSTFEKCSFKNVANFDNVSFEGFVTFDGSQFNSSGWFRDAKFGGSALFYRCTCKRDFVFQRAEFSGVAVFSWSHLGQARSVSFQGAHFRSQLRCDGIEWPAKAKAYSGAFANAQLSATTHFGGDFSAFQIFDGLELDTNVSFDLAIFKKDRAFQSAVRSALVSAQERFRKQMWDDDEYRKENEPEPTWLEVRRLRRIVVDSEFLQLEGSFRILKSRAEAIRDKSAEFRYFRYELLARRLQSTTPTWERLFSHLYALGGDYGGSIMRPFINLVGLWILFAGVYTTVALKPIWAATPSKSSQSGLENFIEGARMSAHMIFAPLTVWSGKASLSVWEQGVLDANGPLWALSMRLVASTESLATILLVFLAGLALRRRFQIG